MARRRGPALYELINDRPAEGEAGAAGAPVRESRVREVSPPPRPSRPAPLPAEDDGGSLGRWLSPGRVVRVPIGYFFFAAAIVLAAAFGGYVIGYQRHAGEYRQEQERQATEDARRVLEPTGVDGSRGDSGGTGTPGTPRTGGTPGIPGTPGTTGSGRSETARPGGTRLQTPGTSGQSGQPGTGEVMNPGTGTRLNNVWMVTPGAIPDPREPGLNYYRLATSLTREETVRLALFLGENGVGVVLLPRRDGGLTAETRQGFGRGTLYGPEGRAFESRLRSLGRRYKAELEGPTDLGDAFPALLR